MAEAEILDSHRKTIRWERRRDEILRVAEHVFAREGFVAARLDDIARALGMRRPSLVHYFRDKIDLYNAVLENVYSAILRLLEEASAARSPQERLFSLASLWVKFVAERPDAARLLLREAIETAANPQSVSRNLAQAITAVFGTIFGPASSASNSQPDSLVRYAMSVAGMSLFLAAIRPMARQIWSFDTLSPENLERQRHAIVLLGSELLNTPDLTADPAVNPS